MGTPSMIWLKVRKEDYGKVMKADPEKLPTELHDYKYKPHDVKIPHGCEDRDLWIGVYCNYDGYPDGVGEELVRNYNTYEKVLNLILFGELSCICGYVKSYRCWRAEAQTIYKAAFGKPTNYQMYSYYFDEDYMTTGEEPYYSDDLGYDVKDLFAGTYWTMQPGHETMIRFN